MNPVLIAMFSPFLYFSSVFAKPQCVTRYALGGSQMLSIFSDLPTDVNSKKDTRNIQSPIYACESKNGYRRVGATKETMQGWTLDKFLAPCGTLYSIAEKAKIRSAASLESKVIGTLSFGEKVLACERESQYFKVGLKDRQSEFGWIDQNEIVSEEPTYPYTLKIARKLLSENNTDRAILWAERARLIAETDEVLELLKQLYSQESNRTKLKEIEKLQKVLAAPAAIFSSKKCKDFSRGANQIGPADPKTILENNPWIKMRKVFIDEDRGVEALYAFKFSNGRTSDSSGGPETSSYKFIEKVSCEKGIIVFSEGVGDCGGGSWSSAISLWDGKKISAESPSFSSDLSFYVDDRILEKTASLYDCRNFAIDKSCRKIWSEHNWIGKDDECSETQDGSPCGGICGESSFISENKFEISTSLKEKKICEISQKGTVTCVKKR